MNYAALNQTQREYLNNVIDAVNRQDASALHQFHNDEASRHLLGIYTLLLDPMPSLVTACHNRLVHNLHYKRAQHVNSK